MTPRRPPTVFVSSTCYDLKQVRADLQNFLENMGLVPLLSEYSSFPVIPDAGTLENCRETVESRADILVLIVGGRYGSLMPSGKSITNLEYLQARAKGIPVYVFVQRAIIDILAIWKSNPDADFSKVADSPKLFEFVESLREKGDVWVHPFDTAQDICGSLRQQLAVLFMDALWTRTHIRAAGLPEKLQRLSGTAIRLILERPRLWEARLFGQVLADELQNLSELKRDVAIGVPSDRKIILQDSQQVKAFTASQIDSAIATTNALNTVMTSTLAEAMGPPGVSGDPELLVYCAQRVAASYKEFLLWTQDCRSAYAPDLFKKATQLLGDMTSNCICEIEQFSREIPQQIESAVSASTPVGECREVRITLRLSVPKMDALYAELDRIQGETAARIRRGEMI